MVYPRQDQEKACSFPTHLEVQIFIIHRAGSEKRAEDSCHEDIYYFFWEGENTGELKMSADNKTERWVKLYQPMTMTMTIIWKHSHVQKDTPQDCWQLPLLHQEFLTHKAPFGIVLKHFHTCCKQKSPESHSASWKHSSPINLSDKVRRAVEEFKYQIS